MHDYIKRGRDRRYAGRVWGWRVAWRRFWQQNEYRSSFDGRAGSQTSFGVVEAVYLGAASCDSGVGDVNKAQCQVNLLFIQRIFYFESNRRRRLGRFDYSETRLIARRGDPGATPKLVLLPVDGAAERNWRAGASDLDALARYLVLAVSCSPLCCSCHAREGIDLVLHVELSGSLGLGAVVGLQVAV